MSDVTVGVSLKAYFDRAGTLQWMRDVAAMMHRLPALPGNVRLFIAPGYLQLVDAVEIFRHTRVEVAAQDVSAHPRGPFTGEVPAEELSELGVTIAEIGHAERRRLLAETDRVIAAKTAAAMRAGLTPLLCVGESDEGPASDAVSIVCAQVRTAVADSPAGALIIAYEPVWAIGAQAPASRAHIDTVCRGLREFVAALPGHEGSTIVYGGSAGPGLLSELDGAVDGVFLGRFAHDVDQLERVLLEAAAGPQDGDAA